VWDFLRHLHIPKVVWKLVDTSAVAPAQVAAAVPAAGGGAGGGQGGGGGGSGQDCERSVGTAPAVHAVLGAAPLVSAPAVDALAAAAAPAAVLAAVPSVIAAARGGDD